MLSKFSISDKNFSYLIATIILALGISALTNLQLFQDGASYFFEIIGGQTFAIRHSRLGAMLPQLPVVLLIKLSSFFLNSIDNKVPLFRFVFSFSYALIPITSLGLSWLIARKRKEGLIIWSALVILFINLVNFSWVSEILFALQLSCPLFLAYVAIPETRLFWLVSLPLFAIIFSLHPLVVLILFALLSGITYLRFSNRLSNKFYNANLALVLFLLASRVLISIYGMSEYEKSFSEAQNMSDYLLSTSLENQLFLLAATAIGAICLIARRAANDRRLVNVYYIFCGGLVALATCVLISQYRYTGFYLKTGLSFFVSILILIMMLIDGRKDISQTEIKARFELAKILALAFFVVILTKSFLWEISTQRLSETLSESSQQCLEMTSSEFIWLRSAPYKILDNWALPSLALISRNSSTTTLVLEEGCQIYEEKGLVRVDPWTIIPKEKVVPKL